MRPRAQRPPIARRSETISIDVGRLEPSSRVSSGAQDRQPHRFLRSTGLHHERHTETAVLEEPRPPCGLSALEMRPLEVRRLLRTCTSVDADQDAGAWL